MEWVQAGTFQVVACLLKGTQFQQARLCGRCGLNVRVSISKDASGASAQGTPRSWWSPHPWWPWDSAPDISTSTCQSQLKDPWDTLD